MTEFQGGQIPPPQYQPLPPKKKHTGLKVFAAIVVVGLVGLVGCVAVVGSAFDEAAKDTQGTNVPAATNSSAAPKASTKTSAKELEPYEYTDLKVTERTDGLDTFAGTITIHNNTDKLRDYYVTVTVFKGSQDVGTLMGTIKVKPSSSGKLKLTSIDDFVGDATDYQVSITPGFG